MIRIVMAVLMGIAVLAAVWWLPQIAFNALIAAMVLFGLIEYARMFFSDRVERWSTVAAGVLISVAMLFCPDYSESALIMLVLVLFGLSLVFMWRTKELPGVADRLGLAMFGVVYLGVAFSFWGLLRAFDDGTGLVLMALVPACLCDTFAYIAGKSFGRRPFAAMVSPKKTVEGFIGALAGSLAGTFAVRAILLPHIPWHFAVLFAFIIWIVSPVGDLIESLLKRSAGVKDSGSVIPGHGGVLDRLDALIFTGPAAYVFARFILKI